MYKENENKVLTLKSDGLNTSMELPWDADIERYLNALYALCIHETFYPETIISGMMQFAVDHMPTEMMKANFPNVYADVYGSYPDNENGDEC